MEMEKSIKDQTVLMENTPGVGPGIQNAEAPKTVNSAQGSEEPVLDDELLKTVNQHMIEQLNNSAPEQIVNLISLAQVRKHHIQQMRGEQVHCFKKHDHVSTCLAGKKMTCQVKKQLEWDSEFELDIQDFCAGVPLALRLANIMNMKAAAGVVRDVKSHPIFHLIKYGQAIGSFEGTKLQLCVVETLGILTNEFRAQMPADPTSEEHSFSRLWSRISEFLGSSTPVVYGKALVAKIIDAVVGAFTNLIQLVTDKLDSLFATIKLKLVTMILNIIDASGFADLMTQAQYSMIFMTIIILVAALFLSACQLIGVVLALRICRLLESRLKGSGELVETPLEAHGEPMEVGSILGTLLVGIFGLLSTDAEHLRKRCLQLTALVAGGTILANVARGMFALLPSTLRVALVLKFGSEAAVAKMHAQDLLDETTCLMRVCKLPPVLSSVYYRDRISDLIKRTPPVVKELKEPGLRAMLLNNYSRMVQIIAILEQHHGAMHTRPMPFSVHIAGAPGLGKTVLAPLLIQRAFSIAASQIYGRPLNDVFWSGYVAHEAVLYDEFFIGGDAVARSELAKEYLGLVSTGQFQPNMPSVDNPTCGIKGTCARPKVVVSINNTRYNVVEGIESNALQRRREFVIEVTRRPDARMLTPTKVDMGSYTIGEVQSMAWLQFRLLPGVCPLEGADYFPSPYLDFEALCMILANKYATHQEVCELLGTAQNGAVVVEQSVQEIIEDALRESQGIPNQPLSVTEALMDCFNFKAQGPIPEEPVLQDVGPGVEKQLPEPEPFEKIPMPGSSKMKKTKKKKNSVQSEEFESCEDSSDNTHLQKDIIAGLDHNNVDPNYIHRHQCPKCQRHWVHKHPPKTHLKEELLCKKCLGSGHKDPIHKIWYGRRPEETESQAYERLYGEFEKLLYEIGGFVTPFLSSVFPAFRPDHPWTSMFKAGLRAGTVWFSIALGIVIVTKAIAWFAGSKEAGEKPEITFKAHTGSDRNQQRRGTREKREFRRGMRNFHAQAELPVVKIYIGGRTLNGVGLRGRTILTYEHAFMDTEGVPLAAGTPMSIEYLGKRYLSDFQPDLCNCDSEYDIITFDIRDNKMPQFPDITKKFLTSAELEGHSAFRVVMTGGETQVYGQANRSYNRPYRAGNYQRTLPECYVGLYQAVLGDCGRLVQITTGSLAGRLLGIHVAGTSAKATCPMSLVSAVSRESLEDLLEAVPVNAALPEQIEFSGQGEIPLPELSGPNLADWHIVPFEQRVFLPHKTKLKPTPFATILPWKSEKQPAIVNKHDPRSGGRDPVYESIQDTLSPIHPELDETILNRVMDSMRETWQANVEEHMPWRTLTFEEACVGIPGILSSLRTNTSPGLPLVHLRAKRGKKDFVWFDEKGEFHYNPFFRNEVEHFLRTMREGEEEPEHTWLGYLKDELVRDSKIQTCMTRAIYCGNLIAIVAFRMQFGAILANINNSFRTTTSAIGLNQYSYDMQVIYDYLTVVARTRFVAGDYKGFDKRFHPRMRDAAYTLLMEFADKIGVPKAAQRFFVKHETTSPAQFGPYWFKTVSNHMSGCFFTTIVNCLVNEAYFRYIFAVKYPALCFDDHIRIKTLGDDHILAVGALVDFNPLVIQQLMPLVGQVYTGNDKEAILAVNFERFEDLVFLGAHPRMVAGRWTGALRKPTLEQATLWMRSENDLDQTMVQMVELASQWDRAYYEHYTAQIKMAYAAIDRPLIPIKSFLETQDIVANRTADSGHSFGTWFAQGPIVEAPRDITSIINGKLTQIDRYGQLVVTFNPAACLELDVRVVGTIQGHGRDTMFLLHQQTATFTTEMDPTVLDWRFSNFVSNAQGTFTQQPNQHYELHLTLEPEETWDVFGPLVGRLVGLVLPNGVYKLFFAYTLLQEELPVFQAQGDLVRGLTTFQTDGATSAVVKRGANFAQRSLNEQAMDLSYSTETKMFRKTYEWTTDDVAGAVIFNISTPYELLVLGDEHNIQNMPFANYIYWEGDVSLTIQINGTPFQQGLLIVYFYPLADGSTLDTANMTMCEHVLMSPNTSTTAVLTVPFRFYRNVLNTFENELGGAEFLGYFSARVLAPLASLDATKVSVSVYSSFPNSKFTIPRPFFETGKRIRKKFFARALEAQAANLPEAQGQGYSTNSVNNTYNVGDVAGNMPIQADTGVAGQQTDIQADLSVIPMDNPPLVSGAIPVAFSYSGMSKVVGVEPTVGMQSAPESMSRQAHALFRSEESKFAYLLGLPCYWFVFNWSIADVDATPLFTIPLNSILAEPPQSGSVPMNNFPLNLALLNYAMFWRADFEFTVHVVRTRFHSGRLRATIGYGAPVVTPAEQNLFYNQVLDFNGENDRATFVLPYNAATEYMRTYEGPGARDPMQNYSLGTLNFFVANQLRVASSVATAVKVVIFGRVLNASLAVPRPLPFFNHGTGVGSAATLQVLNFVAPRKEREGFEFVAHGEGLESIANETEVSADQTTVLPAMVTATESKPIAHRLCRLAPGNKFEYTLDSVYDFARRHSVLTHPTSSVQQTPIVSGNYADYTVFGLDVTPATMFRQYYAGWAGSIKFRIFGRYTYDVLEGINVFFVPDLDPKGIPDLIPLYAHLADSKSNTFATSEGGQTLSTGSVVMHQAREKLFSTSPTGQFIDVSVPFETHFNFCGLQAGTQTVLTTESIGHLIIFLPKDVENFEIFQAVGDDFQFGHFRPPLRTAYHPFSFGTGVLPEKTWDLATYKFITTPPPGPKGAKR